MTIIYKYRGRAPARAEAPEGEEQPWTGEPPHIPGVPARDLEQSDIDALPKHLQTAVKTSDLYQAAPKEQAAKPEAAAPAEPAPARRRASTEAQE